MTASKSILSNNLPIETGGFRSQILGYLKQPVVYHSLFWTIYFIFNVIRWGGYNNDYLYAFKHSLIEFPLHAAFAYCNIYYLIPNFLPKKYFQYISLILIGVALVVLSRLLVESIVGVFPSAPPYITYQYVLEMVIGEVYVQGFITALKLLLDWGKNQKRMRALEKSNFETELDFLGSQVQPHFFFNTLNNLYSLTLDKSDLAPETVLKLSELMSYVIYDGKQKKVLLSREISYIQNYIDLEKLRFGNKLKTKFEVKGHINDQQVAPLLLLPFIENSFKHGAGNGIKEIKIDIGLEVSHGDVTFTVQNLKYEKLQAPAANPYHHIGHNGVGVENIKRRLELIYGKNYQLDIRDDPDKYTVKLKIPTYENTLSNS
jgi:sensor histidine kinase YesM